MAAREKRTERAERRAHNALAELGRELRLARSNHDLSQKTAGRAAGLSQPAWSRLESGTMSAGPLLDLARALAVVGLDLHVRAYPGGSPLRDQAHVELLERLRRRLGPRVHWKTEVPLPNPGDRRTWDALVIVSGVRIGVEAETRARDAQELQRRLAQKRKDGAVDHVILLLADTRHHRAFLRAAGEDFRSAFPLDGRTLVAWLAASSDPGGSGIVLL
jgi:transcriptional regulator with XRE-family HTH domain